MLASISKTFLLSTPLTAVFMMTMPIGIDAVSSTVSRSSQKKTDEGNLSSRSELSYRSAGERRLNLLTRPFGQEYRGISKQGQVKSLTSPTAAAKGKAPLAVSNDGYLSVAASSSIGRQDIPSEKASASRKRQTYWRGVPTTGSRLQRYHRQQKFAKVWKEQSLGTHLSPEALADKVVEMRLHGVNPMTAGIMASDFVQAAKKGSEYETRYHARMQNLNHHYSRESIIFKKDPVLSQMDVKKKTKMILDNTFESAAKQQRKDAKRKRVSINEDDSVQPTEEPLSSKRKVNDSIERVGAHIKDHLSQQGHDFYKMPLMQLEEQTRDLSLPDMKPIKFSRHLHTYIQARRGVNSVDMATFKQNRALTFGRERTRKKRAQGRPRQAAVTNQQIIHQL